MELGAAAGDSRADRAEANFRGLEVGGEAQFSASRVNGITTPTTFHDRAEFGRSHFSDNATFRGVVFRGPANFWLARIDGNALFEAIALDDSSAGKRPPSTSEWSITAFRDLANFDDCRVQGTAEFAGCRFEGKAVFSRAHIAGRARFGTAWSPTDCWPTIFGRDAEFFDLHIASIAVFAGAQFHGDAKFQRCKIDGSAFFRAVERDENDFFSAITPTIFHGTADFLDAKIAGSADFDGVQFIGNAVFVRTRIGGDAWFGLRHNGTHAAFAAFARDVDFSGAIVDGNLVFRATQFFGEVFFSRLNAGGSIHFTAYRYQRRWICCRCLKPLSFVYARIAGQLTMAGVRMRSNASFEGIDVSGNLLIRADPGDLALETKIAGQVNFRGARIGGVTELTGNTFEGYARLDEIRATGSTDLRRTRFRRDVSFKRACFSTLILADPDSEHAPNPSHATEFAGDIDLRDCSYDRIHVGWSDFLERSFPFDRQPYLQMEKVIRLGGNDREAGNVYYAQRTREMRERAKRVLRVDRRTRRSWSVRRREIPRLAFDVLQWLLFRFGVRPYRLAGLSIAMIALGAFVFSRPGAVAPRDLGALRSAQMLQDDLRKLDGGTHEERAKQLVAAARDKVLTDTLAPKDALWLSLRLFAPIVEIPAGGDWQPSAKHLDSVGMSARAYAALHRLAGAILVPLGLASLTGLLVRRDRR